jgi:putative ABC transport system ATP-binding protein
VFTAQHLSKIYKMGQVSVQALMDVLLGPSGSGKSTLLNILGGLDRPANNFSPLRRVRCTVVASAAWKSFRASACATINVQHI